MTRLATPTPVPPEERVELATTHIAEPTGIEPPSRYGPSVNDPEQGIPRHAYSPFDDPPESSTCPPGGCEVVADQLAVKLSPQAVRAQRAQVNASAVSSAMADVEYYEHDAYLPAGGAGRRRRHDRFL